MSAMLIPFQLTEVGLLVTTILDTLKDNVFLFDSPLHLRHFDIYPPPPPEPTYNVVHRAHLIPSEIEVHSGPPKVRVKRNCET